MKILILSEFFPQGVNPELTGGVEARNYFLSKYLSEKNEATIFCSRISSSNYRQQTTNYRLVPLGLSRAYLQSGDLCKRLLFIFSCVFQGLRIDFDVIDGSNFVTHLAAIILGFLKRKPVFLWYADVWVGRWIKNIGLTGIIGEILERSVLTFGKNSKFIAISEYTKNNLIKNGILGMNIAVIPLGVDEEELDMVAHGQKKYDLIAVNRLVKYKKTEEIIEAINFISKNKLPKVLLIGEGPEKENLQNLINKYELQKNVEIISGQNHKDVMKLISQSKIFISASNIEGFGIAPVEAAGFGLPCLLKNIAPYQEHEKNLGGCLMFKNSKELSDKILLLLKDNEKYKKLSEANMNNSRKFFWKKIAKETEGYYD